MRGGGVRPGRGWPLRVRQVRARRFPALGDLVDSAIDLSGIGASGVVMLDMTVMTYSSEDPVNQSGDEGAATAWLSFTADAPGVLHVSTEGEPALNTVVEAYGDDLGLIAFNDDDENVGAGESYATLDITVATGVTYLIKVRPHMRLESSPAGEWDALPVSWEFTARTFPLVVDPYGGDTTLPWTPTQLKVNVLGAEPGQTIDFRIDDAGSVVYWYDADDTGAIVGLTVPVPELAVGSHTLDAYAVVTPGAGGDHDLDITGNHASFIFTVSSAPLTYPTALAGDAAPVSVPQEGVRRWVLQDPAPEGEQFVFPINPTRCGSRNAPKRLEVDVTTAFDGQPLTWEGSKQSAAWWFEGTLIAKEHLEALQRFTALHRRIWLIDEHGDAWVVTLETLKATPRITADQPWFHTYRVDARILAGPVAT